MLALFNDQSVTFSPNGGTGTNNGYGVRMAPNSSTVATINVDHSTSAGTAQTLTVGSLYMGNAYLTVVNGHGYSLNIGTVTGMTGAFLTNDMTSGTVSLRSIPAVASGTLTINGTSPSAVTVAGAISETAPYPLGLAMSGAGTLILSTSNSYSGGTVVSAGVLQLGNSAALGVGGLVANAGAVNLANYSPTVTSLSGSAGTITNSVGPVNLTVSQSATTTFGGALKDGAGARCRSR